MRTLADYKPKHFRYQYSDRVATLILNRPERKNALTFESYAELRDLFLAMKDADDVKAIVLTGAGENFCSGGDVHEIIGPLTKMDDAGLLNFTQMTGDLVKAMRSCPQPIVAAVDGIAAGAGAILAMASDLRFGTLRAKVAFLFVRVGLAGCDMGACAILPRIIGHGRAAELLYTGRVMEGTEAERWGFFNRLCAPESLVADAQALAAEIAHGPTAAHTVTKEMLQVEWDMPLNDAIDAEARAQAQLMKTKDFHRAYEAFIAKQKPKFEGN